MPKKHRGISIDFWTDEKVVALSPLARLLFVGSWHYCCDEGHLCSTPVELKLRVLPADNCDVGALVEEILTQGLYVRTEAGITVPNLPEHQQIDKRWKIRCDRCGPAETPSAPPEFPKRTTGVPREDHARSTRAPRDEVKGSEVKGSEGGAGGRKRPATRAPESLDITDDMREWAQTNAPLVDLSDATDEFLTWAKSVDKRYSDWTAAWRNAMKRRQQWQIRDGRHLRPVDDNTPDWMLA